MHSSIVLVLGALAVANGEDHAVLQDRDLHTLTNRGSGTTTSQTPTSSVSTMKLSTSTSSIETLSTSASTGPVRWALTTVFTQPSECVGGITQYPDNTDGLWENIVNPAKDVTLTSCYPAPFLASATATTVLPPYEQLVCPYQWEPYDYNATYRICCPRQVDYGLYAPGFTSNTDRPGQNAWCTSWVRGGYHAALTVYDADGHSSLKDTTLAPTEAWLVQATAFDGIIATSVTKSSSSSPTWSTTEPSAHISTTTSSSTVSTPRSTSATTTTTTSSKPTPTWTGPTSPDDLPECGITCIGNMIAKYKELGCSSFDPACLCRVPDFNYGVRDCSNAACDSADASTVITFETSYWCPSEMVARTTYPTIAPTPTTIPDLPSCGQTCFKNMMGQYSQLGCSSPEPSCLCKNPDFGYGIRDCSNGACGADVGRTVIAFASSHYCAPTPMP